MDRVFGNYVLEERIGAGGMGEVYRGIKRGPEDFEVKIALKLILPQLAQETSFRRMFSREARLAAMLKHPNIVQVSGFDILDGTPFIEMEYVEGSDLSTLLKTIDAGQVLPMEESVHVIHGVARGLDYAHTLKSGPDGNTGIVHRDLNPHNILISTEGEIKIADFGIARAALAGTSASATLMGKLAYMSPEQIEGRPLDYRSDLFSLGTTAYQILTGYHPFQCTGEARTLRAVQEVSYRPLSEAGPTLPLSIVRMVESLLTACPDDRPGSAQIVADTFEQYLKPAAAKTLAKRVRILSRARPVSFTDSTTSPTRAGSGKKSFLYLIAAAALTSAATILFLITTGPTVELEEPTSGQTPVATPPPANIQPATTQILQEVRIPLKTVPSGARVYEGETDLGLSPVTVTIPPGVPSRELTISLDRYEQAEISLTRSILPDGLTVTLTPLPTGTLRIGAIPWAHVRFRGEEMGLTPLVIKEAPAGTNRLTFLNDELGIRKEVEVRIEEGNNPVFVLDLTTGKAVRSK